MIKLSSIKNSYQNYILIAFLSALSFLQIITVDYFFSVDVSVRILEYIAIGNILSRISVNILCFEDKVNEYALIDVYNSLVILILTVVSYLYDPLCFYLFIFFSFRELLKLASKKRERISYIGLILSLFSIFILLLNEMSSKQFYLYFLFLLPLFCSLCIFKILIKVRLDYRDLFSIQIFKKKTRTIYSDTAVHINTYLISVFPSTLMSGNDFILFRKLLAVASLSSLVNSFSLFYFKSIDLNKINPSLFIFAIIVFIINLIFNENIYVAFSIFFTITIISTIFYSYLRAQLKRNTYFYISLISPIFVSLFFLINVYISDSTINLLYFFNLLIFNDILVIYFINKKLSINNTLCSKRIPDKCVFVAGPPKSGTSFLYDIFLKNNFSSYVGKFKEPDYWYSLVFPNHTLFDKCSLKPKITSLSAYLENYSSKRLLIDFSPSTSLDIKIIEKILESNPDAYFIFIERNNKDRALSQYRQFNDSGFENETLDNAKKLIDNRLLNNWHLSYNYDYKLSDVLEKLRKVIKEDRLFILQFNDLICSPETEFKKICKFIQEEAPANVCVSNISRNSRKIPRNRFVKYLVYLTFKIGFYNYLVSFSKKFYLFNFIRKILFK